jgi:hypothetical protein
MSASGFPGPSAGGIRTTRPYKTHVSPSFESKISRVRMDGKRCLNTYYSVSLSAIYVVDRSVAGTILRRETDHVGEIKRSAAPSLHALLGHTLIVVDEEPRCFAKAC